MRSLYSWRAIRFQHLSPALLSTIWSILRKLSSMRWSLGMLTLTSLAGRASSYQSSSLTCLLYWLFTLIWSMYLNTTTRIHSLLWFNLSYGLLFPISAAFQHCWSLNDWLLVFSLGRNNMEDQKMIDPVDNHLWICYWKKVRCANSQKVVKMWSQSCRKNVLKLSHKCLKVVAKMS